MNYLYFMKSTMNDGELTKVLDELEETVDGLLGRLEKTHGGRGEGSDFAQNAIAAVHLPDEDSVGDEAAELIRRAIKRLRALY